MGLVVNACSRNAAQTLSTEVVDREAVSSIIGSAEVLSRKASVRDHARPRRPRWWYMDGASQLLNAWPAGAGSGGTRRPASPPRRASTSSILLLGDEAGPRRRSGTASGSRPRPTMLEQAVDRPSRSSETAASRPLPVDPAERGGGERQRAAEAEADRADLARCTRACPAGGRGWRVMSPARRRRSRAAAPWRTRPPCPTRPCARSAARCARTCRGPSTTYPSPARRSASPRMLSLIPKISWKRRMPGPVSDAGRARSRVELARPVGELAPVRTVARPPCARLRGRARGVDLSRAAGASPGARRCRAAPRRDGSACR